MSSNYEPVDGGHASAHDYHRNDHDNVSDITDHAQLHNNGYAQEPSYGYAQEPTYGHVGRAEEPAPYGHAQEPVYGHSQEPVYEHPQEPAYGYGQDAKSYPTATSSAAAEKQRRRKARNLRLWMWELLGALFSFVCIAVVVIVLKYEDGRRLDGWALMVGPNAVISFITTLAKSSCLLVLAEVIGQLRWVYFAGAPRVLNDLHLFDKASRGPWGALRLMFRMKSAALLASFASLLTIAALVIDPFAQLVFSFPTRPTETSAQTASFQIANVYDANTTVTANHGVSYPVAQNAPFQLQSAVISAAFGVNPAFNITCPTSNCTYPPISTLGICSTCEDVTSATSTACGEDTRPNSYGTLCNTTVPHQLLPASNFTWGFRNDAAGMYSNMWNSSTMSVTPSMAALMTGFGDPAILAAFTTFKLDRDFFANLTEDPSSPSSVNQCLLAYCLKTYDVEVLNGETKIASINESIMDVSSYQWFLDPPETGNPYFTMRATDDGGQPTGANYTMNWWDHLNLGQYMEDVLNSSVYMNTGTLAPGDGGKMAPSFGLAMYNADNLTAMVRDMAESMTNSMRTSQDNATTLAGTALVLETYIHIEWKWLALPIAVSVLSFVLLVTVMIISTSHNVEAWKSYSMPLLFYTLEGWGSEYTHGFRDSDDLKQISKNMKGHLSMESEHRVFVREGFDRANGSGE